MATKYLARTVIEGGRARYNKLRRRWSHRVVRQGVRMALQRMLSDPEAWSEEVFPLLYPEERGFADKLGPAYRFLASRVGKPWNETYALIRRRFDHRTTAGRHILFDHLLASLYFEGHDHEGIRVQIPFSLTW